MHIDLSISQKPFKVDLMCVMEINTIKHITMNDWKSRKTVISNKGGGGEFVRIWISLARVWMNVWLESVSLCCQGFCFWCCILWKVHKFQCTSLDHGEHICFITNIWPVLEKILDAHFSKKKSISRYYKYIKSTFLNIMQTRLTSVIMAHSAVSWAAWNSVLINL